MDGFRLLTLATAPRELGVFKPGCQIVVSVSCSKVVSQKYLRVLSVLCWFIIAHGLDSAWSGSKEIAFCADIRYKINYKI